MQYNAGDDWQKPPKKAPRFCPVYRLCYKLNFIFLFFCFRRNLSKFSIGIFRRLQPINFVFWTLFFVCLKVHFEYNAGDECRGSKKTHGYPVHSIDFVISFNSLFWFSNFAGTCCNCNQNFVFWTLFFVCLKVHFEYNVLRWVPGF